MTTGMKQLMADVRAFHEKCGVPVKDECRLPSKQRLCLRMDLTAEEYDELDDSMWQAVHAARGEVDSARAIITTADALADLIYVLVGTALELGIPLDRVWAEVHASNMTKSADHTRADGKILKGPNYRPPDIHKAIWGSDDPPSVGGEGGDT